MLHTYLTDEWDLRYPILGAPMANVAHGRLAHAISQAGGLGMVGVGFKDSVEMIERESSVARGSTGSTRFGIGLMAWAIEIRRELLNAAIGQRPFLLAISFGSVAPYADEV